MVLLYTLINTNLARLSLARTLSVVKYSPGISRLKLNLCDRNYSYSKHSSVRFYAAQPKQSEKPVDKKPVQNVSFESDKEINLQEKQSTSTQNNILQDVTPTEKLGLFQKFKKMYKEYWYVMVPVHLVTSAMWLGGFYYVSIRYVLIFWN